MKTVAIVGRPNVGKSALFNRLAGLNISIVHDLAGVTRDRITAECRRGPQVFQIMDTGGIGANTEDILTEQVQVEASIALDVADLLLFVVDVVEGVSPIDQTLATMLRRTRKPVVLVCNKADSDKRRMGSSEFSRLGFQDVAEVSAAHGLGIDALVDIISEKLDLKEATEAEEQAEVERRHSHPLKLAIIGRPNAGKSSLVNAILGEEPFGLAATPVGDDGLVLEAPQPVERLPGFADGHCSVQDTAAQLAAGQLLDGRHWAPADRVLDACAAPGGKTAHLLERADVNLLALDVDPRRCERIEDTLERLGLKATVRAADAAQPATWWDGQAFDAILLDAPCTASGIVRRHPDVRWLRRASDVDALVATQRALLEALWPLLKPGGRLVYATCSVFRAEGSEQVQAFLVHHTDALHRASPGHLLPGLAAPSGEFNDNPPGGYDGFFYACIDKAAQP